MRHAGAAPAGERHALRVFECDTHGRRLLANRGERGRLAGGERECVEVGGGRPTDADLEALSGADKVVEAEL